MVFTNLVLQQLNKHVSQKRHNERRLTFLFLDENNVYNVFKSLDRIEKMLDGHKYLVQDTFTEADIRLFTTIVR